MLTLTNSGKMCSGLDAIEFLEALPDIIDEDIKTEEFCERYEDTLNRLRCEVRKSIPAPVVIQRGRAGNDFISCRSCAHGLMITDKHCPGCGRPLEWPPAGERYSKKYSREEYLKQLESKEAQQ